jgi:type III restriction enzyme
MQLKIYQENAIDELLEKAKRLLGYSGKKKLVFKSPTGSGKTIMMAEFLKRVVDDREIKTPLSFIWTAPRKLHEQSRKKLENYSQESQALECSFFEDLDDRRISENEILFFNWESINKADNVYIRDNEQDLNLSTVLNRTKEGGREIVLVIDEAHHHAKSDISKGLIKMMGPKLTIDVSATPKMVNPDELVNVPLEKVKAEGMIKKAVILNEEFENLLKKGKIKSDLSGGSEELVIDSALKKREELRKAFQEEKTNINPLIMIQLPDRIGQLEDTMKHRVIRILEDKYKISTENGKLAIWLSGEHVNKEDVEKHDSEVEVLIFKQAIALGWDCPRAQILVLFREWHSPIFSIQTVGRIMRMPEPVKGHYDKDILNYGYVYTNLSDIEIQEDIARDYITIYTSRRQEDYGQINLLSCYSKRHREKTRLTLLFIELFLKVSGDYRLKKKINTKAKKPDLKLINEWKAEDIDVLAGETITGDKAIKPSGFDLQRLFDFFARKSLREGEVSFYPEDRSVGRIKEAIYKFFETEFKMERGKQENEAAQIVLSDKNKQHFVNVINITKTEYKKEVVKREPELVFRDWDVPESLTFGEDYKEEKRKKSIMQPFYSKDGWRTEKEFIEFLERSKNIEWWFKNGERDATFFAVPYKNKEWKPFYIDFIVKLKNGRIGLFDTKSGLTLQVAKSKINGLYDYIKRENKKSKRLFGGIVTNTNPKNYRGRWIYFDKQGEKLKDNDFSKWRILEL